MDDPFTRVWRELLERPDGPMAFRVYLQPVMATIYAFIDGRKDARAGRSPYFWALSHHPAERWELVKSGWRSIGKVAILAIVMDVVYQVTVLKGLRPVEGLLVAVVLAIVPYVFFRGVFDRLFGGRPGSST